ncbi:MAG: SLBB domain-containing protein [Desulfobacterales bacterium]
MDSESGPDEESEKDDLLEPKEDENQPISRIENILSGEFPSHISRQLKQFGYDYFKNENISFVPENDIPVGNDYVIGPGDHFRIQIWGKHEDVYDVAVSREGGISLPRIGTMYVNGLSYADMKHLLYQRFREYYTDFQISITMGELRTMTIFVVGEALSPGTYTVSSLSTLVTVLFEAGGPGKNGSMRNIQLIRDSKIIQTLDLYSFFLEGDKSRDRRLKPGDTIYIPVIGPVAGIAGNVRRPAIYELKVDEDINRLIRLAGGMLPTGNLHHIVLERIESHKKRIIKSFDLKPDLLLDDADLNMQLKDGDLVKIHPVHEEIRNVVFLEGHVKYPRGYEYHRGMRLKDLIPSYDALLPEPYLQQGEIMRRVPPDDHIEIVKFNPGEMLEGDPEENLELKEMDRVIVYHKWEKKNRPEIRIKGAVNAPGTYFYYDGMDVKDLIFHAGNLTDKAYLSDGSLTRIIMGENGTQSISLPFSPKKALAEIESHNIELEPFDTVYIRQIPRMGASLSNTIHLEGEFVFPGEYSFSEGERISSVIERAGGISEEGYPYGAIFERETVRQIQAEQFRTYMDTLEEEIYTVGIKMAEMAMDKDQAAIMSQELETKKQLLEKLKGTASTGRMVIDLSKILSNADMQNDFELKPGDRLIVNRKPDHIIIMGEVYNPTALLYEKEKTIRHYLNRVGGITDDAQEKQIYLVKANGDVISRQQDGFLGLVNWDTKNHRWTISRGFEHQKLDPGDTIIVPKKMVKYPWLAPTKSITEIMYQIAVTAGVIIAAY